MTMIDEQPETETADAAELRVRDALRGLSRVEAPSDFVFRVKARIASAPPQPRRRWFPAFAVSSVAVFVLAFGLIFLASIRTPKSDTAAVNRSEIPVRVDDVSPASKMPAAVDAAATPDAQSSPSVAAERTSKPPANTSATTATPAPKAETASRPERSADDASAGSSRDLSSTTEQPRVPVGLGNTATIAPSAPVAQYSVREALDVNGIAADFVGGRWVVRSVRGGSVGAISGVRPKDVIESIDQHTLDGETVTARSFTGRSLTILRDGARIRIDLRSN